MQLWIRSATTQKLRTDLRSVTQIPVSKSESAGSVTESSPGALIKLFHNALHPIQLVMLLFALGLVLPVLASAGPPQVTLRQGSFTGITLQEDRYNTPVNAFLGIPYAQPPVGNLRLRPPVALNTSSDAFNATAYGFQCPQSALVPAYDPDTPGMSEDCLTINIFQPTGVNFTNEKVPVGINIHPGSFNMGAGTFQLSDR